MLTNLKLVLLCLGAAGLGYGARTMFAPEIVPLPQSEMPHWQFEAAFIFQAITNMALGGAALAALALLSLLIRQMRGAQQAALPQLLPRHCNRAGRDHKAASRRRRNDAPQ